MTCTPTQNKTCKINCLSTLVYHEFCDRSVPSLVLASKMKFEVIVVSLNSRTEGWNGKECGTNQKNVLKNFLSLFVLGQTILSFLCLGTSKILSLGEFDESKNSLDF